jgi:hypothetical protein
MQLCYHNSTSMVADYAITFPSSRVSSSKAICPGEKGANLSLHNEQTFNGRLVYDRNLGSFSADAGTKRQAIEVTGGAAIGFERSLTPSLERDKTRQTLVLVSPPPHGRCLSRNFTKNTSLRAQ